MNKNRVKRSFICMFLPLLISGCAVRRPISPTYRLVKQDTGTVLIPPGAQAANPKPANILTGILVGPGTCKSDNAVITLHVVRKKLVLTVRRDELVRQKPGWLSDWAAHQEATGCIAAGEDRKLADAVVESVVLEPNTAFQLRYPAEVEIGPQLRLQLVSPILRDEQKEFTIQTGQTRAENNGLAIDLKSSDNLLGYETAWYSVSPKKNGAGFRIAPLFAERHVNGEVERRLLPARNPFQFPEQAGFYRLFYKEQQTQFTALLISAETRAELQARIQLLAGRAVCDVLPDRSCVAIPKSSALNLFLPVTVNGKEVTVRWGARVRDAIRESGTPSPETTLPTLKLSKLYRGVPALVEFDRNQQPILDLKLVGGETISWLLAQVISAPVPAPQTKVLGQLIDAGGYRVHLYCMGEGSPVVFIAGAAFSFDWGLVQPEVAKFTRVCTYDPSGTTWSDDATNATCPARVDEIHRLLEAAGMHSPVVLVGYSLGAIRARLYADKYPGAVAGMVIVDHAVALSSEPPKQVVPAPSKAEANTLNSAPELLSMTPIAMGLESDPAFAKLPGPYRDLHRWATPRAAELQTKEIVDACLAAGNTLKDRLGAMPLVVVSTLVPSQAYQDLQGRLMGLSTQSRQLLAEKSGHGVILDEPEVVVQAIRLAVDAVRR